MISLKNSYHEGNKVYKILKEDNIVKARKELSYLVSRDTENLQKEDF